MQATKKGDVAEVDALLKKWNSERHDINELDEVLNTVGLPNKRHYCTP